MNEPMPADPQNWMEKVGILKSLGEINVALVKLEYEVKALKEAKNEMYVAMTRRLDEHSSSLYGNGHEGLKTMVDRVYQAYEKRSAHYLLIYSSLLLILGDIIVEYIRHHG